MNILRNSSRNIYLTELNGIINIHRATGSDTVSYFTVPITFPITISN